MSLSLKSWPISVKIRMYRRQLIPSKKSVEFRGPNVWMLAFAIIVASVGLNVNSTAVIIGAMLISPLMGDLSMESGWQSEQWIWQCSVIRSRIWE